MSPRSTARWRDLAARHWPVLVLVAVTAWLHRDLLAGSLPATGDHLCHLFKSWLMADRLVPSGRITGWSHLAYAGYPTGIYYPVGGDLHMTALRYATLGLVGWERLYGLGLLGVLAAAPLAVYALARRPTGAAGALVGGLLAMGDIGGWRQGGSVFTVYWGVWPYMLAVSLSLLALAILPSAVSQPFRRRPLPLLALAALLALAVLTHPMAAVFLAVAVPLYLLSRVVARRRRERPGLLLGRALAAGALAVALAVFWLLPQLTTGLENTESFGEQWLALGTLLSRLGTNDAFDKFSDVAWALGLAGLVLALVSRRLDRTYPALLLGALVLLAGVGGAALADKVQMERIAAFMKGAWFVLAALAVDRALALSRFGLARLARRCPRSWLGPVVEPLLAIAVGAALLVVEWDDHHSRVGRFRPLADDTWQDVVAADRWLAEQPRGPLDRVLYQAGKLCHEQDLQSRGCRRAYDRHLFAAGPVRHGLPKLKFGFEPSAVFRHLPLTNHWPEDTLIIRDFLRDPEALRNLGVRWVVSLVPWKGRDELQLRERFGRVRVYEVRGARGSPVRLDGPGEVETLAFADERVWVRAHGVGPTSVLRFPVARHPWWKARHGERELPLAERDVVPGTRRILLAAPAHEGETELLFVRPWYARLASRASLIAWIAWTFAVFGAVLARRRSR